MILKVPQVEILLNCSNNVNIAASKKMNSLTDNDLTWELTTSLSNVTKFFIKSQRDFNTLRSHHVNRGLFHFYDTLSFETLQSERYLFRFCLYVAFC